MFFKSVLVNIFLAGQALAVIHYQGTATFYGQQGAAGSCGHVNADSSNVVAVSNVWQHSKSPGPYCGRKVMIKITGGGLSNNGVGKTVVATVADTCPTCDQNRLDLSYAAFKALTGGHLDPPGVIKISWHFCDKDGRC